MSVDDIRALAGLDYAETAVRVMRPFVAGVLTEDELRQLCRAAYGSFSHDAVTPLVQLDHRHWLLELFHGPTLAFKDVALQLLGQLFEKFLSGGDTNITIVGATSGDTGSAAIEAVAGREHIQIFMLHPEGPRQRRPAAPDDDGAGAERPQYRDRRQFRRCPGNGEAVVR